MSPPRPRAAIAGLRGTTLTPEERELFRALPPAGLILFARNCVEPAQVAALTADLRGLFPERRLPVLIDQEGGRVMRLRPPHWPALPAAARIGAMSDAELAAEAANRLGHAIGEELRALGIDVDCAPCLDVRRPDTTTAIGDRAFAAEAATVARLGRAMADGLAAAGVLPVMKHLPGHGRAVVDSHELLPVVDAGLDELEAVDFEPFRRNADLPLAMTAHVVFEAIDPDAPATHSRKVIDEAIRGRIGFRGILMSDDLGMKALGGSFEDRAARAIAAGCDIALHCSGDAAEAEAVLDAAGVLPAATEARLAAALADVASARAPERGVALARLNQLLDVA
ncbi:MAG TPA: beta-N-acetylhexosaminidase [Geminicoccaceae bacterium]|nr:beta-N-acetylhexosaminidase [Geminicoccus sp.]HMU52430.1 beta-N-acetylhexosaminidase [Geminicoccaceae bacterium]